MPNKNTRVSLPAISESDQNCQQIVINYNHFVHDHITVAHSHSPLVYYYGKMCYKISMSSTFQTRSTGTGHTSDKGRWRNDVIVAIPCLLVHVMHCSVAQRSRLIPLSVSPNSDESVKQTLVSRRRSGSPPKFNYLFIGPLPTFHENVMQTRSEVFAQSC